MAQSSSQEKVMFWKKHVEAQPQSGQTQIAYCKQHGISDKAFTYWKRRLGGTKPSVKQSLFVQLTDRRNARFMFPGGAVLECDSGTDPSWLGAIIFQSQNCRVNLQ